jgi:uncharacterized membrane protein YeaQ/YmgE (transglycosylase-associated protein family)
MIWVVLIALILAIAIGAWVVGKLIGLVLMLALAGIIGAAMGSLLKYKGGFLYSIGAGLVGAVIGTIIANVLGAPKLLTLWNLPVFWTAIGAAVVVAATKLILPADGTRRLGGGSRGLLR